MNAFTLDEEAIYHVARRIADRDARIAYLDQVCSGDAPLRGRVEGLLRASEREDSFLEVPTCALTVEIPAVTERPGMAIGPYELMEQIGEGGMGMVFVAEQSRPVRRKVALKVIKPGMDSRQVVARFEAERQALAMMDHPNIAKVLDAGATEAGRPYFVMELVRGLPITEYCDGERLSIRERLELFVLVCRAVQHAHQKGVIHRDLKPSNILVTLHDGVPVPKVIDFGVAKAIGPSLTEQPVYTAFTQLIGTPLYMSPEQVELSGLDVDTRSDIYSLGVLLYELLTGTTPFDSETLRKAALDEMRRIIREEEPPRPSMRLSSLGATLTAMSAKRSSDPRQLNRSVLGELDWIVMKSLEKDRHRRYETANDFAADVMCYLTDKPVEACPPSAWYRFTKYARRNRMALTTVVLMVLAMATGSAVSLWQAMNARAASAEARIRADESKQVIDYLTEDVFGAAAPEKTRGRTLTIHELLAAGETVVPARFGRQPLVEAAAREALGRAYYDLGRYNEAAEQFRMAAKPRSRLLGPGHPGTLMTEAHLVRALCPQGVADLGKPNEAEPIARRVLDARRRARGLEHPETLASMTALAHVLQVRLRQRFNEERAWRYPPIERVAAAVRTQEHAILKEAVGLVQKSSAAQSRALGLMDPDALESLDTLGMLLYIQGDFAGAESVLSRVVGGRRTAFGPLHPGTLRSQKCLADSLKARGRRDAAFRLYLEVAEGHRLTYGPNHVQTSGAVDNVLAEYREVEDGAAVRDFCERWLREVLATPADPDPFQRERRVARLDQFALALSKLSEGHPFDADLAVRAAEEVMALNSGPCLTATLTYANLGRFDMAAQSFDEVIRRSAGNAGLLNNQAWFLVMCAYPQLRNPARAVELARQAVEELPQHATVWNTLGVAYYYAGEWKAAIEALEKSQALEPDRHLPWNGFLLAMAHWQLGDQEQACAWYGKSVAWMEKNRPTDASLVRFRAEAEALLGLEKLPVDEIAPPLG